jgi:hypothetical protein
MNSSEQRTHEALTGILLMAGKYDSLRHKAMAWEETANQNQRNTDYYRGLVVQIGEMFGVAAKTQDDGGLAEDVLCAKVPELVAQAQARLIIAEVLCRMVEQQLAAWDALYPDRKDDTVYSRAVREAVAKWRENLNPPTGP